MALRAQVVDLVGLHLVNDAGEVGRIGEIAVMEHELLLRHMRVLVDVIHPLGVEQRRPPLDAMHLVPLFQQQFGQVRPVLTGHAGDQRPFLHSVSSLCIIDTGDRMPDRPLFVRVHQWAAGPGAPPVSDCPGGQTADRHGPARIGQGKPIERLARDFAGVSPAVYSPAKTTVLPWCARVAARRWSVPEFRSASRIARPAPAAPLAARIGSLAHQGAGW